MTKNKTSFSSAYSFGNLGERVKSFLSRTFLTTKRKANKGIDKSLDCFDSCAEELKLKKEQTVEFIATHPKQATLIAAGVGAILFLVVLSAVERSKRK